MSAVPSNANTSGLEVVGWIKRINEHHPIGLTQPGDWRFTPHRPALEEGLKDEWFDVKDVVTAASAQARISGLQREVAVAVAAADHMVDRATAAEARTDRLAKALERAKRVLDNTAVTNALRMVGAYEILDAALQQETQP